MAHAAAASVVVPQGNLRLGRSAAPQRNRQKTLTQAPSLQSARLPQRYACKAALSNLPEPSNIWIPKPPVVEDGDLREKALNYTGPAWCPPDFIQARAGSSPAQADYGGGYDEHRAKTPPPDLPSLLLDSRIIFLGMPLVPAVTELICAQLIYLQYKDPRKPIYMYINSTGTTRADGETVGFETEGTCIYDAMRQVSNDVYTVNIGVAAGQAALLLSAGKRGRRYCLPHATTLLQMPSMPGSGQQSASEMVIKSNEMMDQYTTLLELLSLHSGNSMELLDTWMQNPFYMTPTMAIQLGFVDKVLDTQAISKAKSSNEWDKEAGLRQVERPAGFGSGMG
eukprot:jgi/Chlat1/5126/Chrsp33S05122